MCVCTYTHTHIAHTHTETNHTHHTHTYTHTHTPAIAAAGVVIFQLTPRAREIMNMGPANCTRITRMTCHKRQCI